MNDQPGPETAKGLLGLMVLNVLAAPLLLVIAPIGLALAVVGAILTWPTKKRPSGESTCLGKTDGTSPRLTEIDHPFNRDWNSRG